MSNVLQILSSNYSGESVNITFIPLIGDVQTFDNVSLPYNFINSTFDGKYSLFFPNYNLTHEFQIPYNPPQPKCRCTEFNNNSIIAKTQKILYKSCNGSLRTISLLNGQNFKDCILINQITASTSLSVGLYGYCNTINDCQTLTQPPTPTQTKTPNPTPSITPSNTPTSTTTPTPTMSVTPTLTPSITIGITNECLCLTITNQLNFSNTIYYISCQYPSLGNLIISENLNGNETIKVCGRHNSISGNSISVSYQYGVCQNINGSYVCP